MDTATAFQIVLDFVRAAITAGIPEPDELARLTEAANVLEDLATNEYGDD